MSTITDYEIIEKRAKLTKTVSKSIIYALLAVWGIIVLFPFYWMLLTSVKSYGEYSSEAIPKFITLTPTFENYQLAFTAVPLADYFVNTIIFTVATTALMLIIIIPAAFAFSRLNFKGKGVLFMLFLSLRVDCFRFVFLREIMFRFRFSRLLSFLRFASMLRTQATIR